MHKRGLLMHKRDLLMHKRALHMLKGICSKNNCREKKQRVEVGVHIADVTHFVDPDSPIDVEGKFRGVFVGGPGGG